MLEGNMSTGRDRMAEGNRFPRKKALIGSVLEKANTVRERTRSIV